MLSQDSSIFDQTNEYSENNSSETCDFHLSSRGSFQNSVFEDNSSFISDSSYQSTMSESQFHSYSEDYRNNFRSSSTYEARSVFTEDTFELPNNTDEASFINVSDFSSAEVIVSSGSSHRLRRNHSNQRQNSDRIRSNLDSNSINQFDDSIEILETINPDYALSAFVTRLNRESARNNRLTPADLNISRNSRGYRDITEINDSNSPQDDSPDVEVLDNVIRPNWERLMYPSAFSFINYSSVNLNNNDRIRHELISDECVNDLIVKLKTLSLRAHTGSTYNIIREIIAICSRFSQEEIIFIRDTIQTRMIAENFHNPDICDIILLIYDWCYPKEVPLKPKIQKYKSVKYKKLVNKDEKSCIICYEEFKPTSMCSTMECCHVFHSKCLNRWLKESYCCPYCRNSA